MERIFGIFDLKLCECGCNKEVTKVNNRFLSGHNTRLRDMTEYLMPKRLPGGWNKGRKISEDTKKKMIEVKKLHAESNLPNCGCWAHRRKSPTYIEIMLEKVVLADFPLVIPQKRFGRYSIDAYLPEPYHLGFEADGAYWHPIGNEHDRKRDINLLEKFQLPIIRLSGKEILDISNALLNQMKGNSDV